VLEDDFSGSHSIEDQNTLSDIRALREYKSTEREYSAMCGRRMLFKKGVNFYLLG